MAPAPVALDCTEHTIQPGECCVATWAAGAGVGDVGASAGVYDGVGAFGVGIGGGAGAFGTGVGGCVVVLGAGGGDGVGTDT